MSKSSHFKVFILCRILWHVVVICQLLDDVAVDNWWMIWTPYMPRELH
jgi:hypothetical protein